MSNPSFAYRYPTPEEALFAYHPLDGVQHAPSYSQSPRRPDLRVGYSSAYYPYAGGDIGPWMKGQHPAPWWADPSNYPGRHYDTRITDAELQQAGGYYPGYRTAGWKVKPPAVKSVQPGGYYTPAGYRYGDGLSGVPMSTLKRQDVVDDVDTTKQKKDWMWRRVAVKNVDQLNPSELDGSYIQRYGYIK